MDAQARQSLARLLRTQRIAALGTISDTAPLVSMVLYVADADFSAFYIHVSQLAQHTQALRQDRRVSLLYGITPRTARYVGGFGKIFDLAAGGFRQFSSVITRPNDNEREPAVREWSIGRHPRRRPRGVEGTR